MKKNLMVNKKNFSYTRSVSKDEIDALNHVNNICYVQWVQEAAERHWNELCQDIPVEQYVWIILKHEIDYLSPAKLDDSILINTWVEGSYGVKSVRIVEIYKNQLLLVRAKTTWCLLEKTSMKPIRIPDKILEIFASSS